MGIQAVMRYFRRKRMRRFEETFPITADTSVLDVGGTPFNWTLARVRPRLTIVNFPSAKENSGDSVAWVGADGRMLPFPDRCFDVAFSNSVIEHVGDAASQRRFADEIARVARAYWVQTPNRWFPAEPHMMMPFIHFLPRPWQSAIIRRFTFWELLARPDRHAKEFYIEHYLRDIRLLDATALRDLFPEARLIRERVGGLTKSLIAVKRSGRDRPMAGPQGTRSG